MIWKVVGAAILTPIVGLALWPVRFDSRDELFDIPKGTFARHMAGDTHDTLPPEIDLVLGLHDVLVLKNSDDVPQFFGPTLLMPGQTFRLPFTKPSETYFSCTAHANGKLVVVVEPTPSWPWSRLAYRVRHFLH
jgi:hypothetical protein